MKSVIYSISILILLFIFVILSVIKINEPGVNGDQLLFVNAAIGPLDSSYIYKTIHGFPVLLMIYIGALKSYIFKPLFYLFGVSIYSIRLPVILIMTGSLYLLYRTIAKLDKKVAIFTLILLATDPSFIAFSRIDYGPVVLEFFFKVATLWCFYSFYNTKKIKYLLLLLFSLALGLFNKANFIWFINSLFLAMLLFYNNSFFKDGKLRFNKRIILVLISYFSFLIYGVWVLKRSAVEYSTVAISLSLPKILATISTVMSNFIDLINGRALYSIIYGVSPHIFTEVFSIFVISFNLIGIVYFLRFYKRIDKKITKLFFFTLAILLAMFAQLFLTANAISPWHTYSIYPFFTILTAVFLSRIRFQYLLLGSIVLYNVFTYSQYIKSYDGPVNDLAWTNKFYDLVKFTDPFPGLVLTTDISIQTNLLTFSKNYSKYTPIEWIVDKGDYESYKSVLQGYFKKDPDILVVVPNNESAIFKEIQPLFFRFIKDYRINLVKIKEFKDGNKVVYTVYKVK